MIHRLQRTLLLTCLMLALVQQSRAQEQVEVTAREPIRLSGLAYIDYYYVLDDPNEERVDVNGFTFRRVYLTTDYRISDAFSGRARLEITDERVIGEGSRGIPYPFIKDLFLRWQSAGGHRITFGIAPPPGFSVYEGVWSFRGLERTVMDLFGIMSSRDFGVMAEGPIAGDKAGYLFMVGNNNSIRVEADKYKRVYGQLRANPSPHLALAAGGDYGRLGDERERFYTAHAFAGYCLEDCTAATDRFRIGVEGFWQQTAFREGPDLARYGISAWAWYYFTPQWGLVARVDRGTNEQVDEDVNITLLLGGLVFQPHVQVRLIPNVRYLKRDIDADPELVGRLTVDLFF